MSYAFMHDGVPLYYEDRGSGQPVVLLPGWTITTRFWQRQITDLASEYRVVTLDLRGAGNSGKTPENHSFSSYARDLDQLLTELDLTDVTLVAWAMGVSVSAQYLVEHPVGRVRRFVWVDHSPRFFVEPNWPYALFGNLTPAALDATLSQLLHDRTAATRSLLASMFYNQLPAADLDWMYAELLKTPTDVTVTMLATVANVDLRPLLPQLDLPILLINGRHSIVPCGIGEWLQEQLPWARAVVLEDAGHAPFWDAAPQFNRAVREFIASP